MKKMWFSFSCRFTLNLYSVAELIPTINIINICSYLYPPNVRNDGCLRKKNGRKRIKFMLYFWENIYNLSCICQHLISTSYHPLCVVLCLAAAWIHFKHWDYFTCGPNQMSISLSSVLISLLKLKAMLVVFNGFSVAICSGDFGQYDCKCYKCYNSLI